MFKLSMVLPGGGPAGGVRSTVTLGNGLRAKGHQVRLLVRSNPLGSSGWKSQARTWAAKLRSPRNQALDWVDHFEGPVESYTRLDDIAFDEGEIVCAVGSYTVPDVEALDAPVKKLRHCRGFSRYGNHMDAWRGPMKTVTVSGTLTAELEEMAPGTVLGVVPNGKEPDRYFEMPELKRDGVGAIYYNHPNKCPEDTRRLMAALREAFPTTPQYMFSTERQPSDLKVDEYVRLAPIEKARELYNRSKIWVLTSKDEGMPGPVLEAMLCGAVVVSADNPGSRELIRDGENGVIVPVGDIDAFVARIGALLSDEPERLRLAAAGKETAMGYTWEKSVAAMEAALAKL